MNIVIIGSGLAGLTAGATLARAGHAVTVLEQAGHIGGVTAAFEQDGFRWELGQLLIEGLGPEEPVGAVLARLGVLGEIRAVKDDRGYVFPDFELRKPADFAGLRWRMERLLSQFPGEARGLDRYWRDYVRFTRLMTLARRMDRAQGLRARYWQARLMASLIPFLTRLNWTADRLAADYFASEKLRCVFISILADFFTPPSQFQGLGIFALNAEPSFDMRSPKTVAPDAEQVHQYSLPEGICSVVAALARQIETHGGRSFTSRPAAKIVVEEGQVRGVVDAAGTRLPADVVVASGAAKETFFGLVGEAHLPAEFPARVRGQPLMDSVFMVHLGVDMDPRPYVHGATTYYYGTYDVEGSIAEAKRGNYHEERAGFVVHVPSLLSPDRAPDGRHALTVYTICPNRLAAGSWSEQKAAFADQLIGYAERRLPGLSQHVVTRAVLTPEDFQARTASDHHAFGGLAPVMGAARLSHRTPIGGLWFVGSQSESGGGVNAVIPAAHKTARRILRGSR
jgi:phytoene dehydrogenase-like protein